MKLTRAGVLVLCLFHLILFSAILSTAQESQPAKPERGHKPAKQNPEPPAKADKDKPEPMSADTFSGLKLRLIGPAISSGRINAIAVNPRNHSQFYAGVASGGVWKTDNDGTTWTPVFDKEGSYSIGAVALDPKDPSVVWVGTGESNSQRSVAYGDGVYRSEDGGKNWKNVGLKKSEHIGRIAIDPRNTNTVYVAAQGPLWAPGGDRGLYKTSDAGKSWKKVLEISENTGVTDVVLDPDNPDVIYAAAYQRRRHVWTMIDGGPESAIYKSTDAGATWTKLKTGLPTVDMGKIGLAVSPLDTNVVYAIVEAADEKGGIFRSQDRGATWERRNPFDKTAMYYAQIIADPHSVDRIYVMNVFLMVSDDGGKTLHRLGEKDKHVDNHAFWADPGDPTHYIAGCDGGVYESWDRAAHWQFKANLPVSQFYDVAVDNALPFYHVYGGMQDNGSLGAPSRTRSASGIVNSDWYVTFGGDGFRSVVDPEDPDTVYAELQYGTLVRFDKRTGERTGISPQEPKGAAPYRWNWDSPLIISPHSHTRLYYGANKLFRSDDRGNSWRAISPDLTRQIDRNRLPVMGKVWGPDAVAKNASTSFYGNTVALAESPKKDGLLYIGTDDGLIQATENGGQSWTKYEKFPGVPDQTFVSRIAASHHDANTVYAAFDNHKNGDFKPYLLKSTDAGKSWKSIASNLPENGPVLAIAEDPVNPKLLFAGTEFGLWFTTDGGGKWVQLKGDFPTIAVHDLAIQARENDLVIGTFGRGIYILDDITMLRGLKPEMLAGAATLFPVRKAPLYVETHTIMGGGAKGFQGSSYYTAENPPYGAIFTYYLKEKLKTLKEKRQDAEKEAAKKGTTAPYPSNDELRAEAEEVAPAVFLTISDASGNPVRRINASNSSGMNRTAWDLRYPAPSLPKSAEKSEQEEDWNPSPRGPLVMPGDYQVALESRINGVYTRLAGPEKFTVEPLGMRNMAPQDRAALNAFQQKVDRLYRAVSGTLNAGDELKARLEKIQTALQQTPTASAQLTQTASQLHARNLEILRNLRGDVVLRERNENTPPSIEDRVETIMSNERMSSSLPSKTDQEAYAIASEELAQELGKLRTILDQDLPKLEKAMEQAGAPWTPGRVPEWSHQ